MGKRVAGAAVCISLLMGSAALAASPDRSGASALAPELEAVRAVVAKYEDPIAAVRDGYLSTLGCVQYQDGGMGIHFLNMGLVGPVPDPTRPPLLIYEPDGDELRLAAVEWFVPLATGVDKAPELFGRTFDGPMEGHEPLMPAALHHYDLHVWLFKPNPAGLFNATNPDLDCARGTGYVVAAEHPGTVAHQE